MPEDLISQIVKLSIAERILLVEKIWDSVVEESAAVPLPDWKREELDRRLEEYQRNPDSGMTWEELRDKWSREMNHAHHEPDPSCQDEGHQTV